MKSYIFNCFYRCTGFSSGFSLLLLRDAARDLDTSVRRERTELNQLSSEGVPLKPPLVYLIIFQEVTYFLEEWKGVEGGCGGLSCAHQLLMDCTMMVALQ